MPFWVEWGDAIWQIAFVLSVVVGGAIAWSAPRRNAKREAASFIVQPTPVERFEEGANTIVEGTLEGGHDSVLIEGATLACIQGLSDSAIDQVPVALKVGDAQIELDGPMELLLGSEEARPRAPFRRDGALHAKVCALPAGPLAAGQLEGQRYVMRWLRSGDLVQARGVLRRAAAQDESTYRETRGRWVLRGTEQKPLTLGSARAPRMAQKDVDRLALGALLGGLAFVGVFIALPALVYNGMPADAAGDEHESMALSLTVTPLHRHEGLEALRRIWHARADADAFERLAELVALKDGCHGAVALLAEHGQTQRAIAAAETCNHPVARLAAARAWYARGDMEHASRALQDVRDDLDLAYSPTDGPLTSRVDHAIGASRAHLARARWRTASRELDAAWISNVGCVADVARQRGGGERQLFSSTGEPCLVLEASEHSNDRGMLEMMQHSAIAQLLLREAQPERSHFELRERGHVEGEAFGLTELALSIPEDPTCPIDPRGAPGLERSVLSKLVDIETSDPLTRQLVATLAARRALIEMVDGRPGSAAEMMAIVHRAGAIAEQERFSNALQAWDRRTDRPALSDAMANAAWDDPAHDREELLRYRATSPAGRALIALGHDRPMLGTFREHFCDAGARAIAAERAGMDDLAREQRAVAREFRQLLEGRRASIMLWVLDRRSD